MKQIEMTRLNSLFEKVVADRANYKEQRELAKLYQEFINDGRDVVSKLSNADTVKRVS